MSNEGMYKENKGLLEIKDVFALSCESLLPIKIICIKRIYITSCNFLYGVEKIVQYNLTFLKTKYTLFHQYLAKEITRYCCLFLF